MLLIFVLTDASAATYSILIEFGSNCFIIDRFKLYLAGPHHHHQYPETSIEECKLLGHGLSVTQIYVTPSL